MKPWYQSKTVWYSVLAGLTLFFALPELQALLGPLGVKIVALLGATVNILLRVTSDSDIRTPKRTRENDPGVPLGV